MTNIAAVKIEAYENLKERFSRVSKIGYAASVLSKDMETVMPEGSTEDRIEQLVALGDTIYELISDPKVEKWLDKAEAQKEKLSEEDKKNLFLMRKKWVHTTSLSAELSNEVSKLESNGDRLHTKYRDSGDWNTMKDWYEKSFKIMQKVGKAKQKALKLNTPYEALLDQFNTGVTVTEVEKEFKALGKEIKQLISQALKKQKDEKDPIPLKGPFSKEDQQRLCNRLAKAVGFDFNRGRLDFIDGHPSSAGSPDDSRITSDCDEDNFLMAVYSTVHEAGHGMYEQNLPSLWRYQPAGKSLGMNIHESQSMVIEKEACRTDEFFKFLEKEAREVFDRKNDPALDADNLRRLVNRVEASFIRVDADDLTYPAHVILRFELEKALVNGEAEAKDIPKLWNKKMDELLGIKPSNPSKGHMQDVHWPVGAIGYFPAYTLGAMGASQFFAKACKEDSKIKPEIAKGNFKPLNDWLNKNVHHKGSFLSPNELFIEATGEPLNAKYYLNQLSQRFLGKPYDQSNNSKQSAPKP
jgi:carboxypeptidase Taq